MRKGRRNNRNHIKICRIRRTTLGKWSKIFVADELLRFEAELYDVAEFSLLSSCMHVDPKGTRVTQGDVPRSHFWRFSFALSDKVLLNFFSEKPWETRLTYSLEGSHMNETPNLKFKSFRWPSHVTVTSCLKTHRVWEHETKWQTIITTLTAKKIIRSWKRDFESRVESGEEKHGWLQSMNHLMDAV